VDNVAVLSR